MRLLPFALALTLVACRAARDPQDDATAPEFNGGATDGGATGGTLAFDETYTLLEAHCAGCHSPESGSGDLDLSTRDVAYAQLVNTLASGSRCADTPHTRVIPGDPDGSLLYQKLVGTQDCGFTMPWHEGPGPGSLNKLTDGEIAGVRDWIASGAPDHPHGNAGTHF